MPSWCVVKDCTAKQCGITVSHFRLPKDPDVSRQWLRLADRDDVITQGPEKWFKKVVCSYHFEDHCFLNPNRTKLIRHLPVYPTLNLPPGSCHEEGYELDEPGLMLEPQVDIQTDFIATNDKEEEPWTVEPVVYMGEEQAPPRVDSKRPADMDEDEYQRKIQATLDYIKNRKNRDKAQSMANRGSASRKRQKTESRKGQQGSKRTKKR